MSESTVRSVDLLEHQDIHPSILSYLRKDDEYDVAGEPGHVGVKAKSRTTNAREPTSVLQSLDTTYNTCRQSLSSSSSDESKLFAFPITGSDSALTLSATTIHTNPSYSNGQHSAEFEQQGFSSPQQTEEEALGQQSPPQRRKRRGDLSEFASRFAYARRPSIEGVTIQAEKDRALYSRSNGSTTMSKKSLTNGDRPISGGSSADGLTPSSSTSVSASGSGRRQLMPAIPTRRGSSKNENGSSTNGTSALGNQTNIQSLAQAIAARAQHIAAVKAAAAAHQSEAGQVLNSTSTSSLDKLTPRALAAGPLTSVLNRKEKGLSVAETVASDYGDDSSDPGNHTTSMDEHLQTADSAFSSSRDRQGRDAVAQSFRWSQGDWADYAAALSQQINVGDANVVKDASQPDGVFIAPPSVSTLNVVRKSVQYAPTELAHLREEDEQNRGLTGLGIADLPGRSQSENVASKAELQSPLFAQLNKATSGASGGSTSNGADTASNLAEEQAIGDAASSTSHASTSHSASRKSRPTPLILASTQSPTNSIIMSPSTARSLASPSLGGRTPPPTMPPSEPLPPLPSESTTSSALRRILSGVSADGSPVGKSAAQRNSSGSGGGDPQGREWKRSSDPSDHRAFGNLPSSSASSGALDAAAFPRKMSLPYNSLSTSSLAEQAAALVTANRASTIAEAQTAEAMLGSMQRPLTYDELQERSKASRRSGEVMVDGKPQRRTSKAAKKRDSQRTSITRKSVNDSQAGGEGEERIQDDDEEEVAEVAGAVVTRVTTTAKGARASLSRAPSIVRRGSSGALVGSAPGSSGTASPDGEVRVGSAADALNRKQTLIESKNARTAARSSAGRYAQYSVAMDQAATNHSQHTLEQSAPGHALTTNLPPLIADTSDERPPQTSGAADDDGVVKAKPVGKPSLNMTTQPKQVSISSSSIANQYATGDNSLSSGRSPSGASLHGQTGEWTPTADTPSALDGYGNPNESNESNNVGTTMSSSMKQQRSFSALHNRRSEMDEDSQSRISASPIERIKRTEGRFAGAFGEVALAFKQLQAEKLTLEKVIRATTPLDGVGQDGNTLSAYLTSMNAKVEASAQEIRKLLDLMEQQRSVMDYMGDTHRLEIEALNDELEELKDDFDAVCDEADIHRGNAIQLTEELDKAQREAVIARAETLRYKTTLRKEEERKEHTIRLLQTARADLMRLEAERDAAQASLRGREGEISQTEASFNPLLFSLSKDSKSAARTIATEVDDSIDSATLAPTTHSEDMKSPNMPASSFLERISALEAELREARSSNDQLQAQVKEQTRTSVDDVARSSTVASVPLSDSDDAERERDVLREKLFQQEQDIAELRAQVALGGAPGTPAVDGSGSSNNGVREALPAAREDQIRLLMTQMSEQRAREAQIRKAYRQVRDELRKMHSAQQHDRKRLSLLAGGQPLNVPSVTTSLHSATLPGALGSASSAASHHSGPFTASGDSMDTGGAPLSVPEDNGLGLHTDGLSTGLTPRNLKRLSLPLVNKMAPPPSLNSAGLQNHPPLTAEERRSVMRRDVSNPSSSDKLSGVRSRPQSMMLHPAGTAPIFSANRRGSRTFSVDFHAAAQRRTTTNPSSPSSANVSPRFQAHQKLFGHGPSSDTGEGAQRDDEEDMERLQTPRQTIVRE